MTIKEFNDLMMLLEIPDDAKICIGDRKVDECDFYYDKDTNEVIFDK